MQVEDPKGLELLALLQKPGGNMLHWTPLMLLLQLLLVLSLLLLLLLMLMLMFALLPFPALRAIRGRRPHAGEQP